MTVKLWAIIGSQPSRSVLYVLKKFKVEFEYIHTRIPTDTRSEEFKKNVNSRGQVPVLEHDGFKIIESATILRYLIDTFGDDGALLPKTDRLARAKVDEILDRHGNFYRPGIVPTQFKLVLVPILLGLPAPGEEETKQIMDAFHSVMTELNTSLEGKTYLTGDNFTIGDLQIYNEVLNVRILMKLSLDEYPNIQRWNSKIEEDPIVAEINKELYEFFGKVLQSVNKEESKEEVKEVQKKPNGLDFPQAKATKMAYRRLGDSGLKVSVLSFGTWLTAHSPEEEQNVIDCVKAAYAGGVSTFDTAEAYGFGIAERTLGKAIKELNADRKQLVIITKIFRNSSTGMNDRFLSRKHVTEGIQRSLKNLELDYVDVVFAHRPDYETPLEETCKAFDWIIEEGYAFYWATSEWPVERITKAIEYCEAHDLHKPIADQCEYSMLVRTNAEEQLRFAYDNYKYGTTIWSPLTGGLLSGKYNDLVAPEGSRYKSDPVGAGVMWPKYIKQFGEEGLKTRLQGLAKIAEEVGCTQAQLCLAWVLVNSDISTAIMGASRVSQIESNLEALEIASKWTPELEERVSKLLDNQPETAMDFTVWKNKKSRRSLRIDYDFGK